MAVKIPLIMADGSRVKTLEELREHFDLAAVLTYYNDGRLVKWLRSGYYDEEAEKVAALDAASDSFKKDLCELLGVLYSEIKSSQNRLVDAMEKNERRERLKQHTADDAILEAIDSVAFTQEELADLLDKGQELVYLCGERFALSSMDGITYIGVNHPEVYLPRDFSSENCVDVEYLDDISDRVSKTTSQVYRVKILIDNGATELWRKSAEQGNAVAQYCIGRLYYDGDGPDGRDYKKAVEWFSKVVEKGDPNVQYCLGHCYYYGFGVEMDEDKGLALLTKAAEQGHAEAQFLLGHCYYYGNSYEKDEEKAIALFTKAAEQGHAEAQYSLGRCYYFGHGVEMDENKGIEWFTKAAEQGYVEAQDALKEAAFIPTFLNAERDRVKGEIRNLLKRYLNGDSSIDYDVSGFSIIKLNSLLYKMTQNDERVEDLIALYDPSVSNMIVDDVSGILFTTEGFYFRRTPSSNLYYMKYEDIEYAKQSDTLFGAWLKVYGNCVREGYASNYIEMKGISYDQKEVKNLFNALGVGARKEWL